MDEPEFGVELRVLETREPTEEERAQGVRRVIMKAKLLGVSLLVPEVPHGK